jgi:hypothetical protein
MQLASFADQPSSVSQCANRNRSVIGCHSAEHVASDECCLCAKLRRAARGYDTGWSRANDYDVRHGETSSLPMRQRTITVLLTSLPLAPTVRRMNLSALHHADAEAGAA